jgi:hypothetical protein
VLGTLKSISNSNLHTLTSSTGARCPFSAFSNPYLLTTSRMRYLKGTPTTIARLWNRDLTVDGCMHMCIQAPSPCVSHPKLVSTSNEGETPVLSPHHYAIANLCMTDKKHAMKSSWRLEYHLSLPEREYHFLAIFNTSTLQGITP